MLCGSVQTLQDKILQAQGVFANLCSFDFLLITPEKLRLTHEGNIEIDSNNNSNKVDNNGCKTDQYLHPQVVNIANIRTFHLEKVAIYSLGKTVQQCSVCPRSLEYLLNRMTSDEIETVPHLLAVMREVEKFWREEVGTTPSSTLISQLCQLTLGSRHVSSAHTRARSRAPPVPPKVEFSRLNTSSSSDSADDLRSSSTSLPKPPIRLPLQSHPMNSPFGASMPTLVDGEDSRWCCNEDSSKIYVAGSVIDLL